MKECSHPTCSCEIAGQESFCSPACERAAAAGDLEEACECPHDDCSGHEEID